MERDIERTRGPEPQPTLYDRQLEWMIERTRSRAEGKVLIKGEAIPWEQSRHAYAKRYLGPLNWNQVAAPGWLISRISQQYFGRGKHTHRGGGPYLFCLAGRGYTECNGVRLDWEVGDLEIIAVTPVENVHQHFNLEPGQPCEQLIVAYWPFMEVVSHETRQIEDSSSWRGARDNRLYRPDDFVPESAWVRGYDIGVTERPATLLEDLFVRRNRWRERMSKARWVIKEKDQPLELNQMGLYRWYVHPSFDDVVGKHLLFWVHELPPGSRSGKQKHQGGRVHYVLEGSGYSIVDGLRYDWQAGDLLLLTIKSGGVIFQHFNTEPAHSAKLVVAEPNWCDILGVDLACGFEQLEDCPEYLQR